MDVAGEAVDATEHALRLAADECLRPQPVAVHLPGEDLRRASPVEAGRLRRKDRPGRSPQHLPRLVALVRGHELGKASVVGTGQHEQARLAEEQACRLLGVRRRAVALECLQRDRVEVERRGVETAERPDDPGGAEEERERVDGSEWLIGVMRRPRLGDQRCLGFREDFLPRHDFRAQITLARFGIAYVPSGTSAPSRATTSSRSSRLAIQLTERMLSRMPPRSSTWSCATNVRSCTSSKTPLSRNTSSHSGSPSQRSSATSCSAFSSRTKSAGRGSRRSSFPWFHTIANTPPGRSTRAISGNATGLSNQWNACAAKTPSTELSSSGIRSAEPGSAVTPGSTRSSIPRMFASGSTAVTSR